MKVSGRGESCEGEEIGQVLMVLSLGFEELSVEL